MTGKAASGMTISPGTSGADIAAMRDLMREYLIWHHDRYAAHRDLIERFFDHAGYQAEIEGLPGDYAPPGGAILLARSGDAVAGCVALRDLGQGVAEMRRMFVRADFQGQGLGMALALAVMDLARDRGFAVMRLDTGPLQTEAIAMYRKLGFRPSPPHYPLPAALAEILVFMECDLAAAPGR